MSETTAPVIIYSTTWCAYCKMVKAYLSDKGVPWVEKLVDTDSDAHAELMEKTGGNFRGVPVTEINGNLILGFDRHSIDEALEQ